MVLLAAQGAGAWRLSCTAVKKIYLGRVQLEEEPGRATGGSAAAAPAPGLGLPVGTGGVLSLL